MYKLTSENLTLLGTGMGRERTFANWRKYYKKLANAKKAAEKDYGKPIEWHQTNDGGTLTSGDLSHVMYNIEPLKFED